jgi:SAM-dependent methyltransferase
MKRMLVAIANYGQKNDKYLSRVLDEYRSMPFRTDIVVLSNLQKDLGSGVEVIVGVPDRNPWSLPFAHKQIFAARRDSYDLFLYSEDDMLVTHRNIEAFLRAAASLPENELPGFFQWEAYPDGRMYFPAVHHHFHWVPDSLKVAGEYTFAQFTNEHSACYLLTRSQLKRAIASGGFLVQPHEGKFDLLVSAATDPYTQCGFKKLLCLSHFDDFLVAHLPNRYAGSELGLDASEFHKQTQAMLHLRGNGSVAKALLQPETKTFHRKWSKNYYEPCRNDLLALFPRNVKSVLSIGSGWGTSEGALVEKGVRVVAIPVDPIIGAAARSRGVEVVCGDLDSALSQLAGQKFDGVLMSGILHLMPSPAEAVAKAASLLSANGVMITTLPNLDRAPTLWRRLRYRSRYQGLGDYSRSGMHMISRGRARSLFRNAGLQVSTIVEDVPSNWQRVVELSGGWARSLFSHEYAIVARKSEAVNGSRG